MAILCITVPAAGQGKGTLQLRVTTDAGVPLENTLVSIPTQGVSQFTTVGGAVTLADLEPGSVRVEVRRIGYQPRDTTVGIPAGATTIVDVALSRVALRLAAVRVTAQHLCEAPGAPDDKDDAALLAAFEQLKMNAAQYIALVRTYPFHSVIHRYYGYQKKDSMPLVQYMDSSIVSGIPQWRYRPGRVVTRSRGQTSMNLPTVEVFADPNFISNHCFHNGGVATLDDSSAYFLIDFTAASRIRTPDLEGTIYLDPTTLQVRRTILRLTRRPPVQMMKTLEVLSDFAEVAPSIPVINRVYSRQIFEDQAPVQMLFEEQRLVRVQFHRKRPGST